MGRKREELDLSELEDQLDTVREICTSIAFACREQTYAMPEMSKEDLLARAKDALLLAREASDAAVMLFSRAETVGRAEDLKNLEKKLNS